MKATRAVLVSAMFLFSAAAAAEPDRRGATVRAFLDAHCIECHGTEDPEGRVSLVGLRTDSKAAHDIEIWSKVYDQLDRGQMPPPDAKQPRTAEREVAAASIKSMLKAAGVRFDELKEQLPARGNWVAHDVLFSGNAMGEAGTPSRVWRLSPESYHLFFVQLNDKLRLNLHNILFPSSSREAPIKPPWNLIRNWEFTDYSSLHRISGEEYEHHLRNCRRVVQAIMERFKDPKHLPNLNATLSSGKSATPEQLEAAVAEAFEVLLSLPLDAAERNDQTENLRQLFQTLEAPLAVEQFLVSVLCHPEVFYRIEWPEADVKRGLMAPRHTARAISFTLTDRMPDPLLWQAAFEGKLRSNGEVRQHVERILNDPAIPKPRMLGFFQEYFGYTIAPNVAKDAKTVNEYQIRHNGGCEFQMGIAANFVEDTDRLVLWVLESDRDVLRTLLTTRKAFWQANESAVYKKRAADLLEKKQRLVDQAAKEGKSVEESKLNEFAKSEGDLVGKFRVVYDDIAKRGMLRDLYGLERNNPDEHWKNVLHHTKGHPLIAKPRTKFVTFEDWLAGKPFDALPEERIGILTQPSWLISMSSNFDNHAIHRGRWIRERLLGGRILEVPITVNAMLPREPHRGLRDRMRVTREDYCWKCHKSMDPLGLPFEQYDHFGRYREQEIVLDKDKYDAELKKNSELAWRPMTAIPIDTTGEITDSGDVTIDSPVKGPFDLLEKLSRSERVEQVFVRHVFRYFLGRNETPADGPTLVAAHKAYRDSNGSFKALLASILSSDSFLYRTVPDKETD